MRHCFQHFTGNGRACLSLLNFDIISVVAVAHPAPTPITLVLFVFTQKRVSSTHTHTHEPEAQPETATEHYCKIWFEKCLTTCISLLHNGSPDTYKNVSLFAFQSRIGEQRSNEKKNANSHGQTHDTVESLNNHNFSAEQSIESAFPRAFNQLKSPFIRRSKCAAISLFSTSNRKWLNSHKLCEEQHLFWQTRGTFAPVEAAHTKHQSINQYKINLVLFFAGAIRQ